MLDPLPIAHIWPKLDYTGERAVYETMHAYLQVVGQVCVDYLPWLNHGWHVALMVTPRGFRTYPLPIGAHEVEITFDCQSAEVIIVSSNGCRESFALIGQSVQEFLHDLNATLKTVRADAVVSGAPNEVDPAIRFADDDRPRTWHDETVQRLHRAFLCSDRVFRQFRTGFIGKSSPSHLFWGGFDLAITRFSGKTAPPHPGGFPNLSDNVTREAYSHEVISSGFWPGGGGLDEAAYYTYAYPSPENLPDMAITPKPAYWHAELGEFILPYAAVQSAENPEAMLRAFLLSSYEAAADTSGWERAALDRPMGIAGTPPDTTA